MAVPKALKEKYVARFDSLITQGESMLARKERRSGRACAGNMLTGETTHWRPDYFVVPAAEMVEWTTKAVGVFGAVIPPDHPHRTVIEEVRARARPLYGDAEYVLAKLKGIRDDLCNGFLDDQWSQIRAAFEDDLLGQAEYLLSQAHYVAAAVLAGAALEDALRGLCDGKGIQTEKENGQRKRLSAMNDELQKYSAYNTTRAKLIRAWAALRNHAAHGEEGELDEAQARDMVNGIRSFIAGL